MLRSGIGSHPGMEHTSSYFRRTLSYTTCGKTIHMSSHHSIIWEPLLYCPGLHLTKLQSIDLKNSTQLNIFSGSSEMMINGGLIYLS